MIEFNGTNLILDAIGDGHTVREVTLTNNSIHAITEPLTKTRIESTGTVTITVIGDIAYDHIQGNIEQINALRGFEAIELTSEIVEPEPDEPDPEDP